MLYLFRAIGAKHHKEYYWRVHKSYKQTVAEEYDQNYAHKHSIHSAGLPPATPLAALLMLTTRIHVFRLQQFYKPHAPDIHNAEAVYIKSQFYSTKIVCFNMDIASNQRAATSMPNTGILALYIEINTTIALMGMGQ